VYGLLGLASDCRNGELEADYSKTPFQVFRDVMEFYSLKAARRKFPAAELVQFGQLLQKRLELLAMNNETTIDRTLRAPNGQLPDLRLSFPGIITGLVTALCPATTKQLSSDKGKTRTNLVIKNSRLWLKKRARDKTHNALLNRALFSLDMNHLSKIRVLPSLDFISVKCQSKKYEKYCTESTGTLPPLTLHRT
jgi:hypothetical protein